MPTTLNQTPNVQECEAALVSHGFKISPRDPKVKPEFTGAFMVTDPEDDEDDGGQEQDAEHDAADAADAGDEEVRGL